MRGKELLRLSSEDLWEKRSRMQRQEREWESNRDRNSSALHNWVDVFYRNLQLPCTLKGELILTVMNVINLEILIVDVVLFQVNILVI